MKRKVHTNHVKQSLFPISIFAVYFVVLLFMSGLHTGLVVLVNDIGLPVYVQILVPTVYWGIVAVMLALSTQKRIKKTYEDPMHRLADATQKVARGDFSVYVPTVHTQDKWDYLDEMIHDFNKMVEELGSIETLKTDFFSNVSHEIKTPLAVICNNAELLQKGGFTQEQYKKYTDTICQAARRLSGLISNMLKLNKLERQAIGALPDTYDVCRQICDCALQFEEVWEEKNIEFGVELEDEAFIEADAGLLEIVWNNLLSNAFKFTSNGGQVRIVQNTEDNIVRVAVSDTGCGMNQEICKHIFDKFYQGDTSHAAEGNGLGLALVKRIVELTDGTIQVFSEEKKGSLFVVELAAVGKPHRNGENKE